MNVDAVQQHFRDLAALVHRAGAAAKVTAELDIIATALEPFKERPLGVFADFLKKADEFDRTGVLPVVATKSRAPAKPRTSKVPKPAAAEVIERVANLYQNILAPTLTTEAIEQELALVDSLKGKELEDLAARIDIGDKVKKLKVKDKAATVKQAVRDRRGMFHRADY